MQSDGFIVEHSNAMSLDRRYRAGDQIEDVCRACKTDRLHTVVVVDGAGRPLRVVCDYCRSEHNYRGGPALDRPGRSAPARPAAQRTAPPQDALPIVSERERASTSSGLQVRLKPDSTSIPVKPEGASVGMRPEANTEASRMTGDTEDLEMLLRRIIREEAGVTPVVPAAKWRGGTLILRPGTPGLQEKTWPIETLFNKVIMIRNRLRTLEQHINASDLPDDVKVKLQTYIT